MMPNRLLEEIVEKGEASEVMRLKATADRLAGVADRVLVLGIGGSYMGGPGALGGPLPPLLQRGEQGGAGRPGRGFLLEGNNVDNDAVQGLIDLVRAEGRQVGDGRHLQERRHAGDGRGYADLPP